MNNEDILYILSNTKFIDWIKKQLNKNYYVDDYDNKFDENDLFYAKKLKSLYELISEYASQYDMCPMKFDQNDMYFINYDGYIFFVYEGVNSHGCFCSSYDEKDMPWCIKFSDVRNSKISEIMNEENDLTKLKQEIIRLQQKGVSTDFIREFVCELLNKNNKKEKSKTYKKVK